MKAFTYNIDYLCQKLSDMSGLPMRIYKDNVLISSYSIYPFVIDPVLLHLKQLFEYKDNVSYFISENFSYYGIINFKNKKIVIGPSISKEYSNQELHDLAFKLNINNQDFNEFSKSIKAIPNIPLESIIQMMCLLNHIVNKEELNIADFQIKENTNTHIINNEISQSDSYKSYNTEKEIEKLVKSGNVELLIKWAKNAPTIRSGTLSDNILRQSKNTFIVTATIISRCAIEEGMDIKQSYSLSDLYIQKCENTKTIQDVTYLQFDMVKEFTKEIGLLKQNTNNSKLISNVYYYIINHLSDSIKVEDIANDLYMSRSHLSTMFKKETGKNISDYVHEIKIEKAKELLKDISKNITLISDYLGYSSSSHFNRIFKQCTNLTPSEYRKSL